MEQQDDFPGEHISRHIASLQEQKNKIIQDAVKEKTRLVEFNVKEDQNKRFPSLWIERRGNEETVWFNDGSAEGLRVVTFKNQVPSISSYGLPGKGKMTLNMGFEYY